MSVVMYFKIQSDQTRITRNALKSWLFNLLIKSSLEHKSNLSLKTHHCTSYTIRKSKI